MATPSESYEDSLRKRFTREAMEKRRGERLAGKLNAPIRIVRGLANIVEAMQGRPKHKLKCQCVECAPDSVRAWMEERYGPDWDCDRPKKTGLESLPVEITAPAKPVNTGKGFKQPRRKWTQQRGNSSN